MNQSIKIPGCIKLERRKKGKSIMSDESELVRKQAKQKCNFGFK